jgi:phosphatidylglycerophosphate synthase
MDSKAAASDPVVLIGFESPRAAERRVAGVAAIAHVAAEARRAGARTADVLLADGGALSAVALEDIRRAVPGMLVSFVSKGESPGRLFPSLIPLDDNRAATRFVLQGTGKPGDGVVSRYLNRPLSRSVSALLLTSPAVRPWHATLITSFVSAAMFLSLVFGGGPGLLIGGLLFHAASVLDGVDGEIARATYRSTHRGAVLDNRVDIATNILFYLGLTVSLTQLHKPHAALIAGWAVVAGLVGSMLLSWLSRQLGEQGNFDVLKRYYRRRWPRGIPRSITEALVMITSRDFFALGSALLIIAGHPRLVSIGLANFATLWVLLIVLAMPPLLREKKVTGLALEGTSPLG